jgi:hypothetical protein
MIARPTFVSRGILGVLNEGRKRGFFLAAASPDFASSLDFAVGLSAAFFSPGFGNCLLLGNDA